MVNAGIEGNKRTNSMKQEVFLCSCKHHCFGALMIPGRKFHVSRGARVRSGLNAKYCVVAE